MSTEHRSKETCDDWTKIPLHCAECGAQFLRKVRHQTYCEEHRHMAGAVIKPLEQPSSNPIDVSTHGPDGHWDCADIARLCALRDRQALEIERLRGYEPLHGGAPLRELLLRRERDWLHAALVELTDEIQATMRGEHGADWADHFAPLYKRIMRISAHLAVDAYMEDKAAARAASETEKEHG